MPSQSHHSPGTHRDRILVLDFGSQYTQLIARRIRERRVYCEIHPPTLPVDAVRAWRPAGLVLSGGPASVLDAGAPDIDPALFELECPVLGICYGMQLMTQRLGGVVERADAHEYGRARLKPASAPCALLDGLDPPTPQVWMSHGDRVLRLPEGFDAVAGSDHSPFAVIAHRQRPLLGLQFHPEVVHTEQGARILDNFVYGICGCRGSWTIKAFLEDALQAVRAQVGTGSAICGLSGGVDSSVAAALVHRAIGERLHCIFVDHGLLRQGEREEVERTFREGLGMPLCTVDAASLFLSALRGVSDPEEKRRIIGRLFIEVFEKEAGKIEGAKFLVQGTLYPDVIESVSVHGPSATIKSHHNVGGLPERMNLELVEPLRELFKDEVREAGRLLALPGAMVARHPFPGPGLAVRIIGEVDAARCETLRAADAVLVEEIRRAGLYDEIWQAFAVLLPIQSVGVMGDARTYENCIALRCVSSVDAMTADWSRLPHEVLARISNRITNEVAGVNRVVYDVSSKPPATIEWE